MPFFASGAGLIPDFPSPPAASAVETVETEEAAVGAPVGGGSFLTPLVQEGDVVAKGAAVASLRHAPEVSFVAPIAGRVARVSLLPGHKVSEVILFRDPEGEAARHDLTGADTPAGLRRVMQRAGIWPFLRRRPFGGMPGADEVPAGIVVMAADTRPHAPDPKDALEGQEEAFARGIAALLRLTEGPVLICHADMAPQIVSGLADARLRWERCGPRHPQASAGIRIHHSFPAGLDAPVWDIRVEDVVALGGLLDTGVLPMMRRVRIAGAALREARTVRTHPGADLRQLTQRIVAPGPHVVLSGSPLDGHRAHWLAPRDRQVTVLPRAATPGRRLHWLIAALTQTAKARPAIPTAALTQSLGAALPVMPLIRALGAGDDETAMKLGVLSLLEEDVALADYVLSESGLLASQLRSMLDRIRSELAP